MIKIVAKMKVQEDKLELFKVTAKELVAASAAEEGNISYTLNVSRDDPLCFAIIENWLDKQAIETHNASEHFRTLLPKLAAMTDGKMTAEIYTEV